ncbi:MAG: fatty acid desaturase family protein [Flavobacteriales bacterium]
MSVLVNHPNQLKGLVPRDILKSLHEVSTLRGIFSIIIEWTLIIAAAYFCERYFNWPLYIICVVFIGARLLALGLIMHESTHRLLSKNKTLNNFLGEVFCAWPLFISMRSYRVKHLAHHKWLNTEQDPDYVAKTDDNWHFPMSFKKFSKIILTQISGLGIFETFRVMSSKQMKVKKDKAPLWYTIARILFYVLVISPFVYFDSGMLLVKYWIIPFATWTQVANRLRRVAEHSGIEGKELALQTRTTKHGFLTHLLLVPKNISYHCEHHLYPGIPCYHLPKVHNELLKHDTVKENFHISHTYSDVFKDCINKAN